MPALRQRHRFRGSGKSARIFDLIDCYWDLIEGDFAKYLHVDARDFIRGTRPWPQFLTYCAAIAQEEGGRFWAAQLLDPRHESEIEKKLTEAADRGANRPPLEGHTGEVKALYLVANQIRLLIQAMTQSEIGFIDGPEGPAERIQARRRALSDALVDAALIPVGGE
jgi:hypothetical protein